MDIILKLLAIYKTLGDESRLRILRILLRGRFNVNELKDILRMGQSRVSRHLKLLEEAGLAVVHRQGTWAYYEANTHSDDSEIVFQLDRLAKNASHLKYAEADEEGRLVCLEKRRRKSTVFHDRIAPDWYRMRSELGQDEALTKFLVDSIGSVPVVADLGCGPGMMLGALAKKSLHVIGVDSSAAMLEEAGRVFENENAGETGKWGKIELRLGSLEHLPLANGEAQAALMNMVLHHVAEPQAALSEVRRVLSVDGKLVVCDLARHNREWMRERYADLWLGFSFEEMERFLNQAGFEVLTSRKIGDLPRAVVNVTVARVFNQGGG